MICDAVEPMALAGIKGGKKDSLHDDTTELVLEVATFDALSVRQTAQRFNVRTEASSRFEKALDTQRVDQAIALACDLIFAHFPQAKLLGFQMLSPHNGSCDRRNRNRGFDREPGAKIVNREVSSVGRLRFRDHGTCSYRHGTELALNRRYRGILRYRRGSGAADRLRKL